MPTIMSQMLDARHSLLSLAVVLSVGCQSPGFRANQLPAQYRAAQQTRQEHINLARVAAPGASESLIAVSDLLEITISTGRSDDMLEPYLARVADDGTVDVPIIGPVPVAGQETSEASQSIVSLAKQRGMYLHPLVTVEIEAKAVNQITVLGAVNEPGVHEIPRGNCDLMSALAAGGGLTDEAGTQIEIIRQPQFGILNAADDSKSVETESGEIQLAGYNASAQAARRGWSPPRTYRFDLARGQIPQGADFRLVDRDVVRIVPRKKAVIHVAGLVNSPGQFELPVDEDVRLLDAVALAGGRSSPAADKIFIIRQLEDEPQPLLIQASLSKAKRDPAENLRLTSGDSVSIEQTPLTAVVDTIGNFFRLTFGVASTSIF